MISAAAVITELGLQPVEWTAAGLLGLAVLMIMLGWLVPRWVLKYIIRDRDEWKTIAMDLKDTNLLLAEAAKEGVEPATAIAKVMTAAQDIVAREDEENG